LSTIPREGAIDAPIDEDVRSYWTGQLAMTRPVFGAVAQLMVTLMIGWMVLVMTVSARAQSQLPYVGQVEFLETASCPRRALPADGRLVRIDQANALYVLLGMGKRFGGDKDNFALPNLQPQTNAAGVKLTPCIWIDCCIFPSQGDVYAQPAPPSPNVIYMATSYCPRGTQLTVAPAVNAELKACNVPQTASPTPAR
jgi:hypothetical protein